MIIGGLNRRITVQQLDGSRDAVTGEWKNTWEDFVKLSAGKLSKRGRERLMGNQMVSIGDEIFTVRYRDDITEQMRIYYRETSYEIKSIEEIGNRDGMYLVAQRVK